MGFVANFVCFQHHKNFKNRLSFDRVTKSLKVGTFLRHSVEKANSRRDDVTR